MKTSYSTLFEEALEAWAYTRQGVIAEVRNVSEKDLDFRPAEGSRSFRELVLHILQVVVIQLEGGGALAAGRRLPAEGLRGAAEGALTRDRPAEDEAASRRRPRKTHAQGDRRLRQAGELAILQMIHRFDGKPGTRLAWMHHGISHEEYHRGQLALYARTMGRVPALTRLILGE